MIAPGADLKIYIATRPIDFRSGHDGLAAVVQEMLGLDPFSGAAFVFRVETGGPDQDSGLGSHGTGAGAQAAGGFASSSGRRFATA